MIITVKGYYFGGKRSWLSLMDFPMLILCERPRILLLVASHIILLFSFQTPLHQQIQVKLNISHMFILHPFPSHSLTPTHSVYPHQEIGFPLFVHVQDETSLTCSTWNYPVFYTQGHEEWYLSLGTGSFSSSYSPVWVRVWNPFLSVSGLSRRRSPSPSRSN